MLRQKRPWSARTVYCRADANVDVVVVGAGIVGLSTAATLLQQRPKLSVAIVDSAEPCAGATGAGELDQSVLPHHVLQHAHAMMHGGHHLCTFLIEATRFACTRF